MSSDFDKDDLEVERNYRGGYLFCKLHYYILRHDLKHRGSVGYKFAELLVGCANRLRSASPQDGYEWVDRRTSLFSKLAPEQQIELINQPKPPLGE